MDRNLKKSLEILSKERTADYDFYNIIKKNIFEQKVAKQRVLNRIGNVSRGIK